MDTLEIVFWSLIAFVGYTYVVYPLILAAWVWARRRGPAPVSAAPASVSVVLAAFNEEQTIERRLKELTGHLAVTGTPWELIVVSDGSTDRTVAVAEQFAGPQVRVLDRPRGGKALALTAGAEAAHGEVVVFADARQRWAHDAIARLLENFQDPTIGAVSGDLVLESAPGVLAGVGAYWKYEKLLRKLESRAGSMVGVSGSISAVRRSLFRPIPAGTVLDDVYWPLLVAMQGYRVVHDDRAHAYDRLPDHVRGEFRRKVRTLSGNYQLTSLVKSALLPWRNPVWFQFMSHKLFRLAVPWALVALVLVSALLPGRFYQMAFAAQIAFYTLAVLGLRPEIATRVRLAAAAASFVVLNTAAGAAAWIWATGGTGQSWTKVSYS
jgi:poly-beta-1,6-N-acetyl-D-glucosamine synthase